MARRITREQNLRAIPFILRLFSYLYHLALALVLLAIAVVTLNSGEDNLRLPMLPWHGFALTRWLLALGLAGLVCTLLAIAGRLRFLFPVWAAAVCVLMMRGFFFSGMTFDGAPQFRGALWLTIGAIGAFLSALLQLKPAPRTINLKTRY